MEMIKKAVLCYDYDELRINESRLVGEIEHNGYNHNFYTLDDNEDELLDIRFGGEFNQRAFKLNDEYDWEIARDDTGYLILIPLKRAK